MLAEVGKMRWGGRDMSIYTDQWASWLRKACVSILEEYLVRTILVSLRAANEHSSSLRTLQCDVSPWGVRIRLTTWSSF